MDNNAKNETITIEILNKCFKIKLLDKSSDGIKEAAEYLNDRASVIKDSGKVIDYERIIIIAALNITHEFLTNKSEKETLSQQVQAKMQKLLNKIDSAMAESLHLTVE